MKSGADRTCQMQAQIAFHLGRILVQQARIQSGVYKTRTVHKGTHDGPLLSEEELLADEIATMEAHSKLLALMAYQ